MLKPSRRWALIAFAPVLLTFYANWSYVWNHFYARVPFVYDSGWFACTVYRAGIMPRNPFVVANEVIYYWGWHISALVSAGSLLSYLFPGGRVDWYCIFQGFVYVPLALAAPLLVRPEERDGLKSAVVVAATSVSFAFGGQVLAAVGYPHFEVFSSGGTAIMLAALAVGRGRIAWVGLAMSVATREDGGLHAGVLLVAVLAADFLGRPFPVSRRRVITMAVVAMGTTLVLVFMQKRLFVAPDAWSQYLVGNPPFAHLSWPIIGHRVLVFGSLCGFVWAPFLATVAVATIRRDGRYLLGWVVAIPWFLLNFTAKQELKSAFALYTGFPFIGSAFWVAAYARGTAPAKARVTSALWPLAFVSVAALAGAIFSFPYAMLSTLRDMAVRDTIDTSAMRSYARALEANPRAYGWLLVDESVAAWTLDTVARASIVKGDPADVHADLTGYDGITFWQNGLLGPRAHEITSRGRYVNCGQLNGTRVILCLREDTALPAGFHTIPAP